MDIKYVFQNVNEMVIYEKWSKSRNLCRWALGCWGVGVIKTSDNEAPMILNTISTEAIFIAVEYHDIVYTMK